MKITATYYHLKKRKPYTTSFGISKISAVIVAIIIIAVIGVGTYVVLSTGSGITTSSQTTSTQSSSATKGTLSVLMADPPYIPAGVSNLYITYADLAMHIAGLPDGQGWVPLNSTGSIDLLGAVNVSQTIASASIPSGVYNMIRFNVS